jgi:hypothetical protein
MCGDGTGGGMLWGVRGECEGDRDTGCDDGESDSDW